ncbi:MAG: hypothetical protein PHH00_04370 [Candidatus Nanoarchaeia archaeon]|nr:hypothetical protein [Candidatus Nanoarchaeia archaeon]
MSKIIYAAIPLWMRARSGEVWDFVERQGHFPLSSLATVPYGNVGDRPAEVLVRASDGLIDLSDELWIFGIGDSTLREWVYAKDNGKPCRSLVKLFDYGWEERAKRERFAGYPGVAEEVLGAGTLPISLG